MNKHPPFKRGNMKYFDETNILFINDRKFYNIILDKFSFYCPYNFAFKVKRLFENEETKDEI